MSQGDSFDAKEIASGMTEEQRNEMLSELLKPGPEHSQEAPQPDTSVPVGPPANSMDALVDSIGAELPTPTDAEIAVAESRKQAMGGHVEGVDLFAAPKSGSKELSMVGALPQSPAARSVDDDIFRLSKLEESKPPVSQGPLPPPPVERNPPPQTIKQGERPVDLPPPIDPDGIPDLAHKLGSNPANYADGESPHMKPPKVQVRHANPLPPPIEGLKPHVPPKDLGRPLTFAEQTGAVRKDEIEAARSKTAHEELQRSLVDPEHNFVTVDLSDPHAALCPKDFREVQPNNFRPYEVISSRIRQFLENPKLLNAAELAQRVTFDRMDMPSVQTEEAQAAGLHAQIALGRPLNRATNKWFIGYAHPSVETLTKVLRTILMQLKDWSIGKELVAAITPAYAVDRSMVRSDGSKITDVDGRAIKPTREIVSYRSKIRIFAPFDYPEQLAVVII